MRALLVLAGLTQLASAGDARRARAYPLSDDRAWDGVQPIGEFVQREPVSGAPPSERTEVRVAYTRDVLWIRVRCFDREPSRLIARQMARDAPLQNEDRIEILLDTFHDRHNAYYFATNPAGTMVDGRIIEGGQQTLNWDGIWSVRAGTDSEGWTALFQIPFKTLAFDAGRSDWGFNIARTIERRREESRWASPGYDVRFYNVAQAGALEGFEGLSQGRGIDVKPYAIGGFQREATENNALKGIRNGGADIFYRLTPNLISSVSLNTDFAETEVDTRQVNLTRFPLFFPEKRAFFLEDAGVFEFAQSTSSQSFFPYFSRRIGLVGGREAPLAAGAKLSGRVGRFDVGMLEVKTRDSDAAPPASLTVGRVKYNFLKQSYAGGIFTNGDPAGAGEKRLGGVDLKLATSNFLGASKNFAVTLFGSKTATGGVRGNDYAYGAEISYPNDFIAWRVNERIVERNYSPALGFVARPGVRLTEVSFEVDPRPHFWNIRQMFHEFVFAHVYNLTYHTTESRRTFMAPINWEFQGGEHLEFNYVPTFERLFAPFEIHPGVVIPPGSYSFPRGRFEYNTPKNKRLFLDWTYWFGGFYNGFDHELRTLVSWHKDRHLTTSFQLEQFWVSLDQGVFRTRLAEFKFDYSFSPLVTLQNFVQYDTDSRNAGLQSRLRWIIKPGNELFFVVNHSWQQDTLDRFQVFESKVRAKLNYTFRF